MATNGNETNPVTNPATDQNLAAALRDMQEPAQDTYDLSTRMLEAAAACRDIADYSNDFADHLEKAATNYVAGMQRLLGRIGRK